MKLNTVKSIVASMLALGLILTANPTMAAEKGSAKGGAADLMSKPIRTIEDIDAIKEGDTLAMACPKCKTISVTRVTKEFKGHLTERKAGTQHLCPGCENAFEVKGHGKAAKDVVVHKCKSCGSKDAFCCVVKGSGPTKGMEKQ